MTRLLLLAAAAVVLWRLRRARTTSDQWTTPQEANRLSRRAHDGYCSHGYRERDYIPPTFHTGTWDPRLER